MNLDLFNKYAINPEAFRNDLLIDVNGSVKRFGDVIEPWQQADFAALDPGLLKCAGRAPKIRRKGQMRAYLERSRGHSKTSDLAIMCCWAMAFATHPIRGYCFAADKDQAALLRDAIDRLCRLNPWLGRIIRVNKFDVTNAAQGHPGEGSKLEISSSDVAGSWGILPSMIICDEVCHWGENTDKLWESIISSAAKRSDCLLCCISNAGFVDSWQWQIREAARTEDSWYFSRLDGPVASWLTEERLNEQKKMLPSIAYARLWLNEWSTGGGDALTTEDIEAAFKEDLQPFDKHDRDFYFIGGLDLALTRDNAAFVILAVQKGGKSPRIKLVHNKLWRPVPGKKIDLLQVERHILEQDQLFHLEHIAFDPWQCEHLAQTIEADSNRKRRSQRLFYMQPFMREIAPTATNLRAQASLTIESFQDHRFDFYPCEPLKCDLHKLRVEEKSYGFRLVSPRTGEGHGDTASAFCLALLIAHELAGKPRIVLSGATDQRSYFANYEARLREYEREESMMGQDDPSGLLDAIAQGRVTVLSQ